MRAGAADGPATAKRPTLDEGFARLDKNRDGKISRDEADTANLQGFVQIDRNGDGSISRQELGEFRVRRGISDNGELITSDLEMVAVGDHKLQVLRAGQGSPVVIFESGAADGDGIGRWREMLPRISQITSVLCYSRAGRGGSELAKDLRTPEAITNDLHRLLESAGYKPPYVLVGASLGGIYARIFAMRYPMDMAGLVLIDPSHERVGFELDRRAGRSDEDRAKRKRSSVDSLKKKKDVPSSEALGLVELNWTGDASVYGTMANIPLVMITSVKGYAEAKSESARQYFEVSRSVHSEVFKTSTLGMHIVTDKAPHAVYHEDPDLVINAVLWTIEMARKHPRR